MRWLFATLCLWTAVAHAQPDVDPDADVARTHYASGKTLYDAGDYAAALKEFEAGRALAPKPEFDFNIARCHDRLGHWPAAAEEYERFLAARPNAPDAAQLRERVAVLRGRAVVGPSPVVDEAPREAPPRLRKLAIGVGVASLALAVAGTGSYLSAWSDYSSHRDSCDHKCDPATLNGLHTRIVAAQAAGGVLLGLAAAAAVADVVLIVIDSRRARAARRGLQAAVTF